MSPARSSFYDTIKIIRELTADPQIIDSTAHSSYHNNRARILRSGRVVSAFSNFETYVEDRLEEIFQELPKSRIGYQYFDHLLKRFFSVQALNGLNRRIRFAEKHDQITTAETELPRIAGILQSPPTFTSLAIKSRGTNISGGDIEDTLKSFGLKHSWNKIRLVCNTIGSARLSPKDDFLNFKRARNKCAHDSNTNIPTADLVEHVNTAISLAISFDILMTYAVDCLVSSPTYKKATQRADSCSFRVRFLDDDGKGGWREHSGQSSRAYRRHHDLRGLEYAKTRPKVGYVVRDSRQIPVRLL